MDKTIQETTLEIKNMFLGIKAGRQNYIGTTDKRLDYLYYILAGRLAIRYGRNYEIFNENFTHWIYDWLKNNSDRSANLKFQYLWYKMMYSVTDSEEEAWDLFFKIADEYFEQLPY